MTKQLKFSYKQQLVLSWWYPTSKYSGCDAIICDGAIRSGKSFVMFISFILWSFASFVNQTFAICGKTVTSLNRNLISPMVDYLNTNGFECDFKTSKNKLTIRFNKKTNTYYLFGGKDEGSAALIQGITLAGVLFDEVVLMPQTFVEQALARCSVNGSKFWFNCNPAYPNHWFYKNWVSQTQQKNVFYLHFKMQDNPSLSENIVKRYQSLYSGTFYERFVEGKWCVSSGLVYPMFNEKKHIISKLPVDFEKYYVSCDYGTVNPMSMGLWGKMQGKWYRIREKYYSSKISGLLKTDEEYYQDLLDLVKGVKIEAVVIDPSAASFSQCIRHHNKFEVIAAKNDVNKGICNVTKALNSGTIYFHESCQDSIREFYLYRWDEVSNSPKKLDDHAMDDIRYFVSTVIEEPKNYLDFSFFSTIQYKSMN